jgi:RNA polymerase sigma factor (sigma-70 family)
VEWVDEDQNLIESWRRCGKGECAHALVKRHYPQILNLFYRLTGARAQAEELTQDVFVRLTEQVASGRPVNHLGAWLYTTALNLWRDRIRREVSARTKGITYAGGDEEIERAPAPEAVETSAHAALEKQAVRRAVLGLAPAQREVIVLYYYHEKTYEEISCTLGIPVGTVRSRLHYAVHALRSQLAPAMKGIGR